MSENRDCGADAAAYALGALEPAEADAFRKHLAGCVVCRDEVAAFQEVADLLPLSAPPEPVPAGLKRRVMGEIHAEARAAAPQHAERRRGKLSPSGGSWWRALPSPTFAAVVIVAALAIAIGAIAVATSGSSTRVYRASVSWPGSASVHVTDGRGELVVRGMPAPPASKVYEVWLQRGQGKPQPTSALFTPTASGSGSVDVPGDLHGAVNVMVTPEPAGGSSVPTHVPVLVARLS